MDGPALTFRLYFQMISSPDVSCHVILAGMGVLITWSLWWVVFCPKDEQVGGVWRYKVGYNNILNRDVKKINNRDKVVMISVEECISALLYIATDRYERIVSPIQWFVCMVLYYSLLAWRGLKLLYTIWYRIVERQTYRRFVLGWYDKHSIAWLIIVGIAHCRAERWKFVHMSQGRTSCK